MASTPLFDREAFRIPVNIVHVCAGGETPFLRRHEEALLRYCRDKDDGMAGRRAMEAQVERARELVAQLWGVGPGDIGFTGSVAEGVSMVVESIAWCPGDNICFDVNEYPSVVAPFALQKQGIELRSGTITDPAWLRQNVDARTRLIVVSYVSYLNGERYDLAQLRQAADTVGALLLVDFTQAAGYLPIEASVADFAFSACYKWLLGTTGAAVAYWNRERQPDWAPTSAGWHSLVNSGWHPASARVEYDGRLTLRPDALRFTRGNPAHGSLYVLAGALDFLRQYDMHAVQRHVQTLTTALLAELRRLGIASSTPEAPERHGASVCLRAANAQRVVEELHARGIYAWNGRGRIRFSFHGFNSGSDVERIVDELPALLRAQGQASEPRE